MSQVRYIFKWAILYTVWIVENNGNFKLSAQSVAADSYERRSPTRGSNNSNLTENFWYFGKVGDDRGGRLREMATLRGSTVRSSDQSVGNGSYTVHIVYYYMASTSPV